MIAPTATPERLARGEFEQHVVEEFITTASARDLEKFILNRKPYESKNLDGKSYLERAVLALHVRLAEDTANAVSKLIQHTEKLTIQTDKHIQHAEKLTQQTEKLLVESVSLTALTKQLRFWTIMLGAFAVVQIVIMVFDYLKHT